MILLNRSFRFSKKYSIFDRNPEAEYVRHINSITLRLLILFVHSWFFRSLIELIKLFTVKFTVYYFFLSIYVYFVCLVFYKSKDVYPKYSSFYHLTGHRHCEDLLKVFLYFDPNHPEEKKLNAWAPFNYIKQIDLVPWMNVYLSFVLMVYIFILTKNIVLVSYYKKSCFAKNILESKLVKFLVFKHISKILKKSNLSIKKESYFFITLSKFFKF